jgi:hypothetical protein
MEVVDTTQINSFAPVRSDRSQSDLIGSDQIEPPLTDAVFVLTSDQLHSIVISAIQEATGAIQQELLGAIQPLQDEVAQLKATVARQDEKIAASEQWQATLSDNQYTQLKIINSIREESHKEEIARTANTTQKTADNITRIAVILAAKEKRLVESGLAPRAYLDRLRKEGMTFAELANVLGLTTDRVRQLAKIASGDQRFNITWHPRKKNTKVFKLRRWDAPGL